MGNLKRSKLSRNTCPLVAFWSDSFLLIKTVFPSLQNKKIIYERKTRYLASSDCAHEKWRLNYLFYVLF